MYSCEATGASSADEVRILIFDDSTEQEDWQSPLVETKLSNPRGTRSMGCMHEENLRNPNGGVANTQPDFDCAKTLFDSYITVRSRSDRLNANAVTDDRVTGKWFFLLPY